MYSTSLFANPLLAMMIKQYYCNDLAIIALLLKDDTTKQQRKRRRAGFTISLLERKRKYFILYEEPVDNEVTELFMQPNNNTVTYRPIARQQLGK
jgi:hypothetical protein